MGQPQIFFKIFLDYVIFPKKFQMCYFFKKILDYVIFPKRFFERCCFNNAPGERTEFYEIRPFILRVFFFCFFPNYHNEKKTISQTSVARKKSLRLAYFDDRSRLHDLRYTKTKLIFYIRLYFYLVPQYLYFYYDNFIHYFCEKNN